MKKSTVVILVIILLSFSIAVYFYPRMPDKMASHWDAQGNVNGYMPKFWGLFLMPLISVGMFLLLILMLKIDPLNKNIEKFRKYFDNFILLIFIFLLYIYLLTILFNLNFGVDMVIMITPTLGILIYYSGILMENSKRNWFVGIKTPWTLSKGIVWDKTHKLGGRLFKIAGIIAILGILFKKYALLFILLPVIFAVIYTIVYSYFEYQQQVKA